MPDTRALGTPGPALRSHPRNHLGRGTYLGSHPPLGTTKKRCQGAGGRGKGGGTGNSRCHPQRCHRGARLHREQLCLLSAGTAAPAQRPSAPVRGTRGRPAALRPVPSLLSSGLRGGFQPGKTGYRVPGPPQRRSPEPCRVCGRAGAGVGDSLLCLQRGEGRGAAAEQNGGETTRLRTAFIPRAPAANRVCGGRSQRVGERRLWQRVGGVAGSPPSALKIQQPGCKRDTHPATPPPPPPPFPAPLSPVGCGRPRPWKPAQSRCPQRRHASQRAGRGEVHFR